MVLQVGDTRNSKETEEKKEEQSQSTWAWHICSYGSIYAGVFDDFENPIPGLKKSKRDQRAGSPSIYANPQGIYAYVYLHMLGHFKKQWKTQGQPQSRYHEHIC